MSVLMNWQTATPLNVLENFVELLIGRSKDLHLAPRITKSKSLKMQAAAIHTSDARRSAVASSCNPAYQSMKISRARPAASIMM